MGFKDISQELGLEHETVTHIGATDTRGMYQNKKQTRLTVAEFAERNSIIIDMWEKGMKQVDIARKMGINANIVSGVVCRYKKNKK